MGSENLVFEDLIMRAEASMISPPPNSVYFLKHDLLRAYMVSEDFSTWNKAKKWLEDNCVGQSRTAGTALIVFETLEDAMLFKMLFGGTISERSGKGPWKAIKSET